MDQLFDLQFIDFPKMDDLNYQ